ncbi:Meiotic Sister-Chromatid recombination aldehyde dehydrogenase [Ascosphaera acerosa]|nr:Meiotic Sister-Chromatid recombination aldehyde dehydrogenase [Ascosphaera acerosa]
MAVIQVYYYFDPAITFFSSPAVVQILSVAAKICFTLLAIRFCHNLYLAREELPVDFDVPTPAEVGADWQWTGRQWLDQPQDVQTILERQAHGVFDETTILSYCPADGRILGDSTRGIPPATADDVNAAVSRAEQAFKSWKKSTFAERRKVLRTLLKYVLSRQNDIAATCCLDTGKTKIDASFGEILVTAEKLQWTIEHGEAALTEERRPTNLLMMYKKNTVRYEPLGVVAACVSWNYAFHNVISPVIGALFAGNSIIVKPSEHTAWSCVHFIRVIRAAIEACGWPADVVQALVCLPPVADVLTSHPQVQHIVFIGSRPVAHHVAASAAKALTPVTVELGGKDPCVVLDDPGTVARLSSITSILMRGVFQSAGQNCVGIERIIAMPGIYDQIVEAVRARIQALRLGPAMRSASSTSSSDEIDMGAMISARSFDELEALIADAVAQGARLLCGGRRYDHPDYPHGHYFSPTLLVDVTPGMRIAQTELFAPVFVMMRASTVADAVRVANSTTYGLGASVFTTDAKAAEYCVANIHAGMVAVNDFGVYYAVGLPFGGCKGSGYGRFGGAEGLRSLSNLKAVCVDRVPGLRTSIPSPLDYPINNGTGAWALCKGVVQMGYGLSATSKATGLLKVLGNL